MRQMKGDAVREHAGIELECERINNSQQNDKGRGRKSAVAEKQEGQDEGDRGKRVSAATVGGDVVLKRQQGKLQAQTELDAANDAFRDGFREPVDQAGDGEKKHRDA